MMKNEALEKLIKKYETKRKVVLETIIKAETIDEVNKGMAVERFLNELAHDLKAWASNDVSDTESGLRLQSVSNWLLLPASDGDWNDYNEAANNNCRLKLDDGSVCNYKDMDWNFAKVTHYEKV